MKFLEKKMTIDDRQSWDFLFWILLLGLGGLLIYSFAIKNLLFILIIGIVIYYIVKLTAKNTKLAKKQMKKEKRK